MLQIIRERNHPHLLDLVPFAFVLIPQLLDFVLGAEQLTLFRRKQLKALVDIHGDVGMGGNLTVHEVCERHR